MCRGEGVVENAMRHRFLDFPHSLCSTLCIQIATRFGRTEAVGLEPTNERRSSPVFKTGSSSGRMASQTIAGAGIEPAHSWFKATDFYQQKLPRIESALRESNPPVQIGSLAPLPLGQGHALSFSVRRSSE